MLRMLLRDTSADCSRPLYLLVVTKGLLAGTSAAPQTNVPKPLREIRLEEAASPSRTGAPTPIQLSRARRSGETRPHIANPPVGGR